MRYRLPSRRQLFPGTPCLFQKDNVRPHSVRVTTAWLRVCVLDWLAYSPDQSPIENVWRIMKRIIRQQTVEQLKSYIHQEWAKWQQLIYSVPKQL